MLIIFILFLNSCLSKEKKVNITQKEELSLGLLIKEKLVLRINCPENIKVLLKNEKDSIEGIRKDNFYEFLIKKDGLYKIFIESEEYFIEETKICIFKFNNNFYYKGPEEVRVEKVFKNEPIKISREKNEEEIIENKVTNLINLDIKTNIEVSLPLFQKPSLVSLSPLNAPEIKEDTPSENSKFINNDAGDYFEMPSKTKQKEKLFGEKLKENLSSYKGLISTCTNIFSDILFGAKEIDKEEVNKEAEMKAQEKAKAAEKDRKENNSTAPPINTKDPKIDPKDVEEITARKQKEEQEKSETQKRFVESVNNTLKNVSNSTKDNQTAEILNKAYDLFKKSKN